jgi:glycosyltransferase involved in cell wall biosynthesis
MTLSFCIIVKDEEAMLARCLESVRNVVDEMIVVDTGSHDRTIDIAKSFGAQVHHFEWCHDFSAARNESLKYAKGDWILVLDADEVLAPQAIPTLKQAIQSENHLVVNLVRQEIGAAQSPYSMLSRLFRRHPEVWFTRPYHAMIDDQVTHLLQREPHWQIGYIPDVAILHEGYQAHVIEARGKLTKARHAMEGFLAAHPDDAYVCSKLGALYIEIGETKAGLELLKIGLRSINRNANGDAATKYELHYHLGSVYYELQQFEQAETHYQAAIQQPILPKLKLGAINNLATLLKETGDLQRAKMLYQKTLHIDPMFAMGYCNLGATLKAMGQLAAAINHYQKAIELNPNYAEAYQNFGVVLLKIGQVSDSLAAFKSAIALHEKTNPTEATRLKQGLREMGLWNTP